MASMPPTRLLPQNSGGDHRGHFDEELNHIDDQHAPKTGPGGEMHVENAANQQRLPAVKAEENAGDLAGREVTVAMIMQLKKKPR